MIEQKSPAHSLPLLNIHLDELFAPELHFSCLSVLNSMDPLSRGMIAKSFPSEIQILLKPEDEKKYI